MKNIFLSFLMILFLFALIGCDQQNNDNGNINDEENNHQTIQLSLSNYTQYISLQTEVNSYTQTPYTTSTNAQRYNTNQITNFSILPRVDIVSYKSVSIRIEIVNSIVWINIGSGIPPVERNVWNASSGFLNISTNGTGLMSLIATSELAGSGSTAQYKVVSISGSIIINP